MEWGSVSDWFSAACNAVMAGVAVYAAANAKDWLSPKLNERKFKFADELIDQFCKLQQEGFYLHVEVKELINTDPDTQGDIVVFRKLWNSLSKRETEYRRNIINLSTAMERMELWGLHPKNYTDFKDIISCHLSLAYKIEESLSIGADETRFRLQNSFEYDKQISDYYKMVRGSHNKIMKHYSQLFID
ncbi:TPA: hypothetical protein OMT82_000391 [Enterobacter cloacae]|nr:hypothetical protein [Enterobacter cloacae]HCR0905039.1 hypothetical protein [Enterobacter cloacae]